MSLIQRVRERLIRLGAERYDEQTDRDRGYLSELDAFRQERERIVASTRKGNVVVNLVYGPAPPGPGPVERSERP